MKTLEKFSKLSHSKILGILTLFLIISFILASLLDWETVKMIIGIFTIWTLIMLILAYLLDEYRDEEPLPLTDFRKVENITNPEYSKLYDVYFKETGRTVNRTEKYYINWLELQATKFIALNEGLPK